MIAPTNVFTQFGGLEITTSSTALQALTDAVLYLVAYPFECSEQLASRILAVAALRDVLTAFQAEGLPPPKEIEAAVARDIARLQACRTTTAACRSGAGARNRGRITASTWPMPCSAPGRKGYEVPQETLDKARATCATSSAHYPAGTAQECGRRSHAYALYVRKQMGDADPARARR